MQNKITDLLSKMKEGNLAVFDDFYTQTYRLLYTVAYGVLRRKDLTEEAVQEAYLALYRNLDKIDLESNVLSYMYTIVKNKALNILKKQCTTVDIDDDKVEIMIGDKNLEPHSDCDILADCREILSEQEYEILTLSLVKGYKRREIAEMLDSNINTVTWRYQQALKKLKKSLKEENYENN